MNLSNTVWRHLVLLVCRCTAELGITGRHLACAPWLEAELILIHFLNVWMYLHTHLSKQCYDYGLLNIDCIEATRQLHLKPAEVPPQR